MDKPNETPIYIYTQHPQTIEVIKEACGNRVVVLSQNRSRDPIDDLLSQIRTDEVATLYAVLPVDKAVELLQSALFLKVRLLQLDGKKVEEITGRPYDPKEEYSVEIIRHALRVIEIKGGSIRYFASFKEMIDEIIDRGYKKIAVFNDTMRQGIQLALQRLGVNIELVKMCDDNNCVQINTLHGSGYRISFPPTGRLTAEQITEQLLSGTARVYYVDVKAEVVPLCE